MPRQPRANQEGIKFHHIMVQGINKAYIFENDILITKYIELMMKYSEEEKKAHLEKWRNFRG